MRDLHQFTKELEDRMVKFSVDIVKAFDEYGFNSPIRPLTVQVIRSSSSIGANYAEANNASSRADFKNKIYIAKKEAGETRYWLRVLAELAPDNASITQLQQECLELNLILQKIISSLKK